MKYISMLFLGLLMISCQKEARKDNVVEFRKDTINQLSLKDNALLKKLTAGFIQQKEDIVKKLASATPEEADRLYDDYETASGEIVEKINKAEQETLDNYYSYYEGENKNVQPESFAQKKDLLRHAGLEFWDIGEGMAVIRPVHDLYLSIFGEYVTPDYKEFLTMDAIDESVLWAADAGLNITWEELRQRVIKWENFIKKYPESKLAERANYNYKSYQFAYLFGMDNTPTYETEDNKIHPENEEEFKKFISEHPESPTAKLAQQMLDNNGKGFDILYKQLGKEFEELFVNTD